MGSRRQRSAIDVVVRVTQHIQVACGECRVAGMLLIDVQGTFNQVSRNEFMRKMEAMGAGSDLVRSTCLFMMKRRVSLVVDDHQCEAVEVETGVAQGSPCYLYNSPSI